MFKDNSINVQTLDSSHRKFGACQKWEPAGRIGDSIVLNIKWMQFVLQNCGIVHSVRDLYGKNSVS